MEPYLRIRCVYKITCVENGRSYIGQCKMFKNNRGHIHPSGIENRWIRHQVESQKNNETPFMNAIRTHGVDKFVIESLWVGDINDVDEMEKAMIEKHNTLVPHGYNVQKMSHSSVPILNKLSSDTVEATENPNLPEFKVNRDMIEKTHRVTVNAIRKQGEPHLIYIYIYLKDGEHIRLARYQRCGRTFDDIWRESIEFVEQFKKVGIEVVIDPNAILDPSAMAPYLKKAEDINKLDIARVRIATMKQRDFVLVAVYVDTVEKRSRPYRVTFGGKTISLLEAYETAKQFVKLIKIPESAKFVDQLSQ